jgi:hypothetical protein
MWRRVLTIGMVFAFGLILSQLTWAFDGIDEDFVPCAQSDLEGTWSVEVGVKDEFGNHVCWEVCNLTIGPNGAVEQGGTYIDCLDVSSEITGGQLTLSYGCVIEGYIETSNGTVNIGTGGIVVVEDQQDEVCLLRNPEE